MAQFTAYFYQTGPKKLQKDNTNMHSANIMTMQ